MRRILVFFGLAFSIVLGCKCNNSNEPADGATVVAAPAPAPINYSVVKMYPHDTSSYTQGLEWHDDKLYEGSGDPDYTHDPTAPGVSKLAHVDLATGKDLQKITLSDAFFGEGITIMNGKIYQLTWKEHKVFVYDAASLKKTGEFDWTYEGWGLTHNDTSLIISTGGSNLYFVNPATFAIQRTLGVTDNNGYIDSINELEFVEGSIYANVYGRDYILKIDPATGIVQGKLDFSDILAKNGISFDPQKIVNGYVLNGIAYNSKSKTFFITGKRWPTLFEIRLN